MMRLFPPCLLLLLALAGHAQDPFAPILDGHDHFGPRLYASPKDSVDHAHFRAGLMLVDTTGTEPSLLPAYRSLWRESQHGSLWTLSRGDGRAMAVQVLQPLWEHVLHFRTSDGKRGIMILRDTPCGMICRSVDYYVEE